MIPQSRGAVCNYILMQQRAISIHSSIMYTPYLYLHQLYIYSSPGLRGSAGAYHSHLQTKGEEHHEQVISPPKGQSQTNNHQTTTSTVNLESQITLICISFVCFLECGRKRKNPENIHTGTRRIYIQTVFLHWYEATTVWSLYGWLNSNHLFSLLTSSCLVTQGWKLPPAVIK